MLERIEASIIVAENKISVLTSSDFIILFPLPVIKLLLIYNNYILKTRKINYRCKLNI